MTRKLQIELFALAAPYLAKRNPYKTTGAKRLAPFSAQLRQLVDMGLTHDQIIKVLQASSVNPFDGVKASTRKQYLSAAMCELGIGKRASGFVARSTHQRVIATNTTLRKTVAGLTEAEKRAIGLQRAVARLAKTF